jgi:hypothetical protein
MKQLKLKPGKVYDPQLGNQLAVPVALFEGLVTVRGSVIQSGPLSCDRLSRLRGSGMDILKALRAEESKYLQQLDTIRAAIKLLGGKSAAKGKRGMSATARKRMSRAAKARWAKIKAAKKKA